MSELTPEQTQEQIEELKKRRRKRSIALALVLGALAVLFYAVTIIKIGPAIFQRPL